MILEFKGDVCLHVLQGEIPDDKFIAWSFLADFQNIVGDNFVSLLWVVSELQGQISPIIVRACANIQNPVAWLTQTILLLYFVQTSCVRMSML